MKRSSWAMAAAAALTLTSLGACSSDSATDTGAGAEPSGSAPVAAAMYKVGVSNTLAGNGWREQMICSVKAQALASGNVDEVIVISKNGGPTEQIQDLQNLISQGVNAIIVNPSDREKLNPVIAEAAKKGIVVVAVDQAVTAPEALVATNDQVAYGRLGAQSLADQLGGKGKVLYMRGIDGVPADTDRDTGFMEVMANYPDIELKTVWSGWDFTKAADIATQEFTASDYDGVWTSGADYTVFNGIETAGKALVPVIGADTNQFIADLLAGKPGSAVTNPAVIGGVGTAIALDKLAGGSPEQTTLLTPDVWDLANDKATLEANNFPELDANYSAAVSVDGFTTYTPEQLFACKGPGE
ncbi:MAG TPA: substrate-binding domain-containing protein [Dermatophilaceae bacterium]|nr:substrate-binding domain-containing protein [Dermatophilaceae bacterium]